MRFTSIPATEKTFRQTGNQNEYSLQPVDVLIPGETLHLNAQFCKPKNRSGYFHDVAYPKQRIVMHFTAGNLRGDMSTLTRQDFHVSVAFVIARDGTIYQLFPSKFWSGHLGKGVGNDGTGNAQDKATIGIELSNYGFLTEHQGNLETIYSRQVDPATGKTGPADVYCSLSDEDAYQKLNVPFRGQVYYPTHTQAQYESLIVLLRYLTAAFNIPRAFLPEATRFQTTNDVLNFKGIVSHINYRPSGKWDIGPAFDWQQVIAGVTAPAFTPILARDVQTAFESDTQAALTAEDDLLPLLPQARAAAFEDEPYADAGLPTSAPPPNRKLYALVVGINAYHEDIILDKSVVFPTLHGCVADADKMVDYLKNQPGFDADIKRLTDKKATKAGIVKQIREHLGKAGPDDTALLYFSGHGTQEYADASWNEETDGKLECLACYYDKETATDFLLADKELRYLIHELYQDKKPHIVTLFDCCHSGDNTRAVTVAQTAFPKQNPVEKRIPYTFSQRDWSKFVFANNLSLDQLRTDKTTKSLPEGVHVSMSACEADESAVEVGGEGVFTKVLINILHSTGGNITYNDLQSRVRAYLRSVYEQQPRFRVAGGSSGMLYRTFLGGSEQQDGGLVATIVHNNAGWTLDKGAIQGIGEAHQTITGVGEGTDGETVTFRVRAIFPDYTRLEPETDTANENTVYKARIDGLMARKLRIAFELEDISRADRATLLGDVMQRMNDQLTVVEKLNELPAQATRQPDTDAPASPETGDADYVVRGRKGQYYLTYPILETDADDSTAYRPLVKPIEAKSDNALNVLASDLRHIARWEYIRQLENTDTTNRLQARPLLIEIWRQNPDGSEEKLLTDIPDLLLNFWQDDDGWTCPLRVNITNQSEVDLYVSALYLSMAFESYLSFLPDEVFRLEKGKSIELSYNNDPVIGFRMSDVIPLYNWPERVEYFKFIASTVLFSPQEMALEPLASPPTLDKDKGLDEQTRGPGQIGGKPKPKGWVTQCVNLHWQNPTHNRVEQSAIEAMLNDEALADFALGLYFENKPGAEFPDIQLKAILRDLTANVPLREKGLLGDIGLNVANKIARFRRNRRFDKAIKQNPDHFRIVSEGDSWFQHPLVTDTIDHLAAYYPVYCVAAAGDTLRNITMASEGTPPVEEYVATITKQNPAVFVLSGGGNDILGEQFRRYIKEGIPDGSAPADYLEELFTTDLNSLQAMYRAVFGKMQTAHPNLKILVHGYDYIIPLSVTNKGWLGRYMIEKHIDSPDVRKAILRYILTEFNIRMKAVAAEFPATVSYIQTPGTVADDEWYDEIHPNGVGFGKVAEKFKMRIDELMGVV